MLHGEMFKFMANIEVFDASNEEHRRVAKVFFDTSSWKHTNTRFIVERPYIDVVSMIQSKMIEYYTSREFDDVKSS